MISPNFRSLVAVPVLFLLATTPFLGENPINPLDIWDKANPDYVIFWQLRVPRTAGAFLTGASLSLCGLVFQALFRNPLTTPYTLGISSGAAFGAALYFRFAALFGFSVLYGGLFAALAGCALSLLAVFMLANARGVLYTPVLLLAGVIVNFFFSSLVMFIQYAANTHDAMRIMRWLMGSLSGTGISDLWALGVAALSGFAVFGNMAPELDLLLAGEELAASRGVDVQAVKLQIILLSSLIVGVVVSLTGPIGFVGMIIPQICRLLFGFNHARLVPMSFLLGGALLVVCDLISRMALYPAELPVGIITAMLGAPFFLFILFSRKSDTHFY